MSAVVNLKPTDQVSLALYDAMCRAIAAAHRVDELTLIRDRAKLLEECARLAKNVENERMACEIRLRAERRAGQLIASMEKAKGGWQYHAKNRTVPPGGEVLKTDITKKQSETWQKLAAVTIEDFEEEVRKPKASTKGIITKHGPPKPVSPVDPKALWLWGRLQDFEREGLLDTDPNELIATMLGHMKETTLRMAPKVIDWLRRIKT